ncbi:MAG: hypothetical protein KGJ59_13185 [Bacteroidota bacterium]|nr:hypothetical protein [Bacteroidota bacterium]
MLYFSKIFIFNLRFMLPAGYHAGTAGVLSRSLYYRITAGHHSACAAQALVQADNKWGKYECQRIQALLSCPPHAGSPNNGIISLFFFTKSSLPFNILAACNKNSELC